MVKNRSVKETGIITDVPNAARNYKDRIFRMVFREKKALLALYNAMNETDYENEDDLKVTTLESALYLEMKMTFHLFYMMNYCYMNTSQRKILIFPCATCFMYRMYIQS